MPRVLHFSDNGILILLVVEILVKLVGYDDDQEPRMSHLALESDVSIASSSFFFSQVTKLVLDC